jgi:hypothetical protein
MPEAPLPERSHIKAVLVRFDAAMCTALTRPWERVCVWGGGHETEDGAKGLVGTSFVLHPPLHQGHGN